MSARSSSCASSLSLELHTYSNNLGSTNSGQLDSWGHDYFRGSFSDSPGVVLTSKSGSINTQSSVNNILATPRKLKVTKEDLLAYLLYGNDLNFVMDQNEYLKTLTLPLHSQHADYELIPTNIVDGYTIQAQLTTQKLGLLLHYAKNDSLGDPVILRLSPNFVDSVRVARFMNEWYLTSGLNPPTRHRLWSNPRLSNPFILSTSSNINDPVHRASLSRPITLPKDMPGVLYPLSVVDIAVEIDGYQQRRMGLVYPDKGYRTIRDYHVAKARAHAAMGDWHSGGSIRSTISEVSGEKPSLSRYLIKNNLGSGNFDDLSNRVSQLPKSNKAMVDILLDVIEVLKTIATVHELGIVHNGLTSHHILRSMTWSGESLSSERVTITGWDFAFSIVGEDSSEAYRKKYMYEIPDLLPYMSPENTGETANLVDYRTDIYAMGIVLYELVVGCLPFQSGSPTRLRRMHLNEKPIAPIILGQGWLPQSLNDIIMKCLEKDPVNRYMEVHSLIKDLLVVTDDLLALDDHEMQTASRKSISADLGYSREKCGQFPYFSSFLAKLAHDQFTQDVLESFNDHKEGMRYILIQGESGVGKTTLIDEIQIAAVSKYNFVIPWNYNCSDMNVTKYASAIHGLQTVCNQILSSSKENIAEWRHIFTSEVDVDMSILFLSIPELKVLLGPRYKSIRSEKSRAVYPTKDLTPNGLAVESISDLLTLDSDDSHSDLLVSPKDLLVQSGFEEQNVELRFTYMIRKVFSLVASRGLTVILDGIQWCPKSEFLLIKEIADYCFNNAESPSICLVGAFGTSKEESAFGSEYASLEPIKELLYSEKVVVKEFSMDPLDKSQFESFAKLISFPKSSDVALNDCLLNTIYERSSGNRFNMKTIMCTLHIMNQSEQITFDEMGDFLDKNFVTNCQSDIVLKYYDVVLKDKEIDLLKFASIIGSNGVFKLSDLMIVTGQSLNEVYETLQFCIESRFIVPSGVYYKVPFHLLTQEDFPFDIPDSMVWEMATKAEYRFEHDAYQIKLLKDMKEKGEWEEYHRLCGLRYQKKASQDVNVNISNYLSLCTHLVESVNVARENDYERYYETLVTGGRFALATSNLVTAVQFFEASAKFISPDDKRRKIKNLLTICQTNYLLKNYNECIKVIQQAEDDYGKESKVFLFLKIRCLFHLKQFKLGVRRAITALQSLDVEISSDPDKCEAIAKKFISSVPLSVPEIRAMKGLKRATDNKFLLIATLILDILGPTYILGLSLLRLALMAQLVQLMNQYGKCANCALPLIHFANYYIQPHANMSTVKASELCDIALDMINGEEGSSTILSEQINECYIIFMASFRTNTNELLRYSDYYDFSSSVIVKAHDNSLALLVIGSGFILNLMSGNTASFVGKLSLSKIVQFDSDEEFEVFGSAINLWREELSFEAYSKEFPKYRAMKRPDLEFPYLANAILWCVSEGRYKEGAEIFIDRAYYVLRKLPMSILHLEVYFYACICLCFNDATSTRNAGLDLAKRIIKVFESWANACPGNFAPKRFILDACIRSNTKDGSTLFVLDCFEEAIERSSKEGRWMDVALANHLCASWLIGTGESKRRAGFFAQNALSMYQMMKDDKHVERIKKEFASVFSSHNWAGVEIIPERNNTMFSDSTQLNRRLESIFNGDKSEASKRVQGAFRLESDPQVADFQTPDIGDLGNLASQSELSQAIKLCLTISESSNIDSIVSSLLESILQFSGVDYAAIVMNSKGGEPTIRAIGTLNNLYKLDDDPLSLRTDLVPYLLVIHCLLTGEVINMEANKSFFDERFGADHYYTHNPCSSALAIPIKTSTVLGMVYLERQNPANEIRNGKHYFDSKMVDLLDLLCSQSAVAFSKSMLYSQMEMAKKTAEDATAEKASFLANMSHEIRTPFNSLFACSVFLLDTELNTTQREYVETIKNSALVTLSIIDGILAFSKIEHGSFSLESSPFNINYTVESAIQVASEQAEVNDLELVYFNNCPDIELVIGDSTRMRQIIINLVGNAVKFTLTGHIIVTLRASVIHGNRCDIQITVEDTGIGIPSESRSKVFGAFSQVDGSSRRVYGGSGLGLAISKKLADLMNGVISFESVEGKGSIFCFSVPLEVEYVKTKPKYASQDTAIVILSKLRKQSLQSFLEYYGSKVTTFDTFDELIASKGKFDIIFIGSNNVGPERIKRSALPCPDCKIYLIAKFGMVFSELSLQTMKVDALIFTPINRSKVEDILRHPRLETLTEKIAPAKSLLSETYPLRILIVEDNVINLRVALQHLKKLGYVADHAKDGVEAVEKCEVRLLNGDKYDVVFMDIQMPRKDGISATIEIRERFYAQQRPDLLPRIIALTANVAGDERARCIECGMVDFVTKPILPEEARRVLILVGEDIRNNGINGGTF